MLENYRKVKEMIGENPHQNAQLFKDDNAPACSLLNAKKLSGRDLSFNDLVDSDAALALIREFDDENTVALTYHHGNPCGLAVGDNSFDTLNKALDASDPTSIIEGIIVINDTADINVANRIKELYIDVLIAKKVDDDALEVLKDLEQLTVFEHPDMLEKAEDLKEYKAITGGLLIQDYNDALYKELKVTSNRKPDEEEMKQLMIAWKVVKHCKTNAIVLVKDNATCGIGPGLNNRIWSTMQAIERAADKASGSYLATDAIIPLCESIEIAGKAGVKAIIEPGGWFKEDENLEVANRYNMAVVTTGINQFKH